MPATPPPRAPGAPDALTLDDEPTLPPPRRTAPITAATAPRRAAKLLPAQITRDPAFRFRRATDRGHVRSLMQAHRNGAVWDPIVVWQERDAERRATGRLILLDGDHRLRAYASMGQRGPRMGGGIAATIVTGDRDAALQGALEGNTKATLPLTPPERTDATWRLVCDPRCLMSKATIARFTGTSTSRVGEMRRRRAEMQAAGKEPTGSWAKDRHDDSIGRGPAEMTKAEAAAKIASHAQAHRKIMATAAHLTPAQNVEAFAMAMGSYSAFRLAVADYLGGPDEFAALMEAPVVDDAGPSTDDF